jgi:hypothetical protein
VAHAGDIQVHVGEKVAKAIEENTRVVKEQCVLLRTLIDALDRTEELTTSYGRGAHVKETTGARDGIPKRVVRFPLTAVDLPPDFPDDLEAYGDYRPKGA